MDKEKGFYIFAIRKRIGFLGRVARQRSAKPLFTSSNLVAASKILLRVPYIFEKIPYIFEKSLDFMPVVIEEIQAFCEFKGSIRI